MKNIREKIGTVSGTLVHFDCRDNHNCENSFVEYRDHNQGQHVGQEMHFCGHEKPNDFFSLGHEAQVRIIRFASNHISKILPSRRFMWNHYLSFSHKSTTRQDLRYNTTKRMFVPATGQNFSQWGWTCPLWDRGSANAICSHVAWYNLRVVWNIPRWEIFYFGYLNSQRLLVNMADQTTFKSY